MSDPRFDPSRVIRAPRGNQLTCRAWRTEAPLRMLQNNLEAGVAEDPTSLVGYGGIGRAARDWACYDAILESLRNLEDNETLLVQSGRPVAVVRTHKDAPRVLIANSNLVPHWATWDHFNELDRKGLAMYGQIQPDVLIVDILLPGIDGATLITTLRSHPQFARSRLIVVTSLDEQQREPYAFALQGVTVIHKPQLVAELPAALAQTLPAKAA